MSGPFAMEFRNNFVTLKLIFVFGLIAADVDLHVKTINLPIVVNTWPFTNATQAGQLLR